MVNLFSIQVLSYNNQKFDYIADVWRKMFFFEHLTFNEPLYAVPCYFQSELHKVFSKQLIRKFTYIVVHDCDYILNVGTIPWRLGYEVTANQGLLLI